MKCMPEEVEVQKKKNRDQGDDENTWLGWKRKERYPSVRQTTVVDGSTEVDIPRGNLHFKEGK